jgi:hypothetical protein
MYAHEKKSSATHTPASKTTPAFANAHSTAAPSWERALGSAPVVELKLPIQTKLTANQPGDAFEQEADRVADQVMRLPAPRLQRAACACGGAAGPDGECAACKQKRLAGLGLSRAAMAAPANTPHVAPPIVHRTLQAPGQPLDRGTRSLMEARFGMDFGGVRVHTNEQAAASAQAVDAHAYTVGQNVVFGAGQYAPHSVAGQRLLAHELTHVLQQHGGTQHVQRAPDAETEPAPQPNPADKALEKQATVLETEILAHPVYKKLGVDSVARVQEIIAQAKTKPLGDARGQRNYYLTKLKVAITTPFNGQDSGITEYGCSPDADKANRKAVEEALEVEKRWGGLYSDVDEKAVATGVNKTERTGRQGKKFYVDRSDPRNIRVQIKVKLNGKPDEVASITKLEDAIERATSIGTKGYHLDIVFVDKSGPDVFEFKVSFCEWANAGNWASGPVTLSHEVHHALGLDDRYDYIEAHAHNTQMTVAMRLVWFAKQMKKSTSARDPFSKMAKNANPLLAEDVCAVAFEDGPERKKCIDARKDLDPANVPPL